MNDKNIDIMKTMIGRVVFMAMAGLYLACGSPGGPATAATSPAEPRFAKVEPEPDANTDASTDYVIEELALTAQAAMAIRGQAPAAELQARLTTAIPRLVAHAYASGLQLAGPPFVRYPDRAPDRVTETSGATPGAMIAFEAGVPVLKPGAGTDEIQAIELPAGPAIATVHVGPYENLPRAHQALATWARARGREISGPPWEVFLTNPLQDPDPQTWRTKVFLPLQPAHRDRANTPG
jgi:AraC family transcriptional regulator